MGKGVVDVMWSQAAFLHTLRGGECDEYKVCRVESVRSASTTKLAGISDGVEPCGRGGFENDLRLGLHHGRIKGEDDHVENK